MDIVVNEELKAYIDPLTPEEYESLERSILAEAVSYTHLTLPTSDLV